MFTPTIIDRTTARHLRQQLQERDQATVNLGLRLDGLVLLARAAQREATIERMWASLDRLATDLAAARLELNGEGPDSW